jgi:NAD(P)-dependent dehydrogenase (short-subunit alcohol dehydrogenase family)
VDILINNAGGAYAQRQISADGIELTWATNHLAPFLLTDLLLPLLVAAPAGRIVNVTSEIYSQARPGQPPGGAEVQLLRRVPDLQAGERSVHARAR